MDDIKKQKQSQQQHLILPTQSILKLLVRLPESKSNNTSTIALNIITKIFNMNQLKEDDYHHMMHSLYLFKDESQEQVQLKLVQCSLQLIKPEIVTLKNPEVYEKLICIFFTLVVSKNPIIQSTSMTGLLQIVECLFDEYLQTPHKNGIQIFNQLYSGIIGQKVPYIVNHPLSKGICRDMLFHIIRHIGMPINNDEQLNKIVSEKLSQIIYEEMGLDSTDVQFNARRVRDAFRMIEFLHRDISLIKHISLLHQRAPVYGYLRFWILEGILELLQHCDLLIMLHNNPEEQQGQHLSYLQHLLFLVQSSSEQDPQTNTNAVQGKHLRLFDQNILLIHEQPLFSKQQFQSKEIECMLQLTDAIQTIALGQGIKLQFKNYQIVNNKFVLDDKCKDVFSIIESLWQMTAKTINILINQIIDERQVQSLLNVVQAWTNLAGSLGCARARDQFIKYLANQCLSKKKEQQTLSQMEIQCSKVLFNIASLGNILDVKSWYLIMKAMQQFEVQLQKTYQQQAMTEQQSDLQNSDVSIISTVMENLFLASHQYDDQHLLCMIDALNQVTLGFMETFSTSNQQIDPKFILFGLHRITQITKVNWDRIHIFWEFISAHFICISNCKYKAFRESGLDIFSQIVGQGFQYFFKSEMQISLNRDKWQERLLNPIYQMISIPHADVKETLFTILFKLIQNNGHELTKATFTQIIQILSQGSNGEEPANYVNVGFHILELIIGSFLHLLDPVTTRILLPLIKSFRSKTTEQNISFISVNLIWQIADNLSKICENGVSQSEIEDLWKVVLWSLKDLSIDPAPDVRQAALHIIVQIILINSNQFKVNFQIDLMVNLVYSILDDLIGRVAQLSQQQVVFHVKIPKYLNENQYPKLTKFTDNELSIIPTQQMEFSQWEETLKILIQNLNKILKKLGQQDQSEFKEHTQNLYNEVFFRMLVAFKLNQIDLKWEIVRLLRENLEVIMEQDLENSLEWSKDFMVSVEEFICQKLQDNRDVKTVVNRILPEICEIYILLIKGHYQGRKLCPDFMKEVMESYQHIVDQPIQIENTSNIKIWMEDKQIHDYIEDIELQIITHEDKIMVYQLLINNIRKEGSITKLQDVVILKYVELFDKYSKKEVFANLVKQQDKTFVGLLVAYFDAVLDQISLRINTKIINSIKQQTKTNKVLWLSVLPNFISVLNYFEYTDYIAKLGNSLEQPLQWDKITSIDGLRCTIETELKICEWLLQHSDTEQFIINYWTILSKNMQLYNYEEIFYETRQKFIRLILNSTKGIKVLCSISKQLFLQFMKDEYMSGSMPLSRKRVQEITFLLIEMQQLKNVDVVPHPFLELFESLVELVVTKEIEIKQPLYQLLKEIAVLIKKQ